MVHVGLDLSRTRLDVHVMDEAGRVGGDHRRCSTGPAWRCWPTGSGRGSGGPVYAGDRVMNGARFGARSAGVGGLGNGNRRRAEGQGVGPAGL